MPTDEELKQAVAAERDRCAKIADMYASGNAGQMTNRLDTRSISRQIAAAIRKQK